MSAKYQQHPMERKYMDDMTKKLQKLARIDECYQSWLHQCGYDDVAPMKAAFLGGYVQGECDTVRAAQEPAPLDGGPIAPPPTTSGPAQEPAAGGCHADCDGDCTWKDCPQLRDKEPGATGRHCPLDADAEPAAGEGGNRG